jgi:dihydrofolate reductase
VACESPTSHAGVRVDIDEYQLLVHPVVLSGGKSLLEDVGDKHRLKLVNARPFRSGVVLLIYQPADAEPKWKFG